MLVQIFETTAADCRIVRAGSIEDISARDAAILIGLGKAIPAPAPALKQEAEDIPDPPAKRRGRPPKVFNGK